MGGNVRSVLSLLKREGLIDDQRDGAEAEPMQSPVPQLRFRPPHQRIKQTSALAEREKQKMQLSHSLAEPRPAGIALRRRSKTASGPRSFAIRWLSLKVASDPRTKMNQRTFVFAS